MSINWKGQPPKVISINPSPALKLAAAAVVLVLLGLGAMSCWYTVDPEEQGVLLRLGKYQGVSDSGLHFKLPLGIDLVTKVPVKLQKKLEFGFRTSVPGIRTAYSTQEYDQESLMVTGDLNVADVEWVTQYRISDPYKYLFKVERVDQGEKSTFRDLNEAVMREIVGDRTIDEVLTVGRMEIQSEARDQLNLLADQYQLGLTIEQVILQDVNVPQSVRDSWNQVNQAQQEKERLINEAQKEYNTFIPRARGAADKAIEEARGYAVERVNQATGDADRFSALFQEYRKAPEVTRQRIYLEAMAKFLQKVERKYILDSEASGILPMLNLNAAEEK